MPEREERLWAQQRKASEEMSDDTQSGGGMSDQREAVAWFTRQVELRHVLHAPSTAEALGKHGPVLLAALSRPPAPREVSEAMVEAGARVLTREFGLTEQGWYDSFQANAAPLTVSVRLSATRMARLALTAALRSGAPQEGVDRG